MSKADETRAFIIEKTAPIFNTRGYAGTSLSDMTDATGLTKGSIYGNFSGKDEVAFAAFDHNMQQVNQILKSAMSREQSPKQQLLALLQVYSGFMAHPFPKGGCPMLNTAIEADDTHPALRERATRAILSWKTTLTSLLVQGIAEGEFRPIDDPEQVALGLIAAIEGAIMISRLTGKGAYLRSVIGLLVSQVEQMGCP